MWPFFVQISPYQSAGEGGAVAIAAARGSEQWPCHAACYAPSPSLSTPLLALLLSVSARCLQQRRDRERKRGYTQSIFNMGHLVKYLQRKNWCLGSEIRPNFGCCRHIWVDRYELRVSKICIPCFKQVWCYSLNLILFEWEGSRNLRTLLAVSY